MHALSEKHCYFATLTDLYLKKDAICKMGSLGEKKSSREDLMS